MVRAPRGKVVVRARPKLEAGVRVGVARFEEVRCTLEVKNGLDHAVQGVQVELGLSREAPGTGRGQLGRAGAGEGDDEAQGARPDEPPAVWPVPGWKFKYA